MLPQQPGPGDGGPGSAVGSPHNGASTGGICTSGGPTSVGAIRNLYSAAVNGLGGTNWVWANGGAWPKVGGRGAPPPPPPPPSLAFCRSYGATRRVKCEGCCVMVGRGGRPPASAQRRPIKLAWMSREARPDGSRWSVADGRW